MTADPTSDDAEPLMTLATHEHMMDRQSDHYEAEIERLKLALSGRTQSCSQCNASADQIKRLQAENTVLRIHGIDAVFSACWPSNNGELCISCEEALSDD